MELTVLRVTAAATLGMLVVIVSIWTMYQAVTCERPAWRSAPLVASATWWTGVIVYFMLLGLIGASLLGIVVGAVVRLVAP